MRISPLAKWFPVRAGERRLTVFLALQNLLIVGAFIAGRSTRDALFLAEQGRGQLATMYLWQAGAVALFGLAYTPLARRVRQDRAAALTGALAAIGFLAAYLLQGSGPWVNRTLYVYVEVVGALTGLQFWTFANELFHARDAKRLYGFIGAGGISANIVVGLLTSTLARNLGAPSVLLLCAGLLVLGVLFGQFSSRAGRERRFARAATGGSRSSNRVARAPSTPEKEPPQEERAVGTKHLRIVALLAMVTFVTTTLADFSFKSIAAATLDRDSLASYLGLFHAVIGVVALVLQLVGTHRILSRLGVVVALTLLPSALGLGGITVALFPMLWAATGLRGADTLFRYSINDATNQILYLPVPPRARASAKAFIEGTLKPIAIGTAGLMLFAYVRLTDGAVRPVAIAVVVTCGLWMTVLARLRGRYVESLQETMRTGRMEFIRSMAKPLGDRPTIEAMGDALGSSDPREVLSALQLLPHLGTVELDHKIEPLLSHAWPEVRVAALGYYGTRQTVRFANSVFRLFDDPDARVRAAAIDAFCVIGRDRAVRNVRSFLKDPDPSVRRASITGMIRYGGLDGVLSAAEALKALIGHGEPGMREQAARALGDIGVKNFYQPVLELMGDPEARVRRAAIRAAAELGSHEFVLPLVSLTHDKATARDAIDALSRYGSSIVPTLGKVVANTMESPAVRLGAARVLGRVANHEAIELIIKQLDTRHEELRTRMTRALARAAKRQALSAAERRSVVAALHREICGAFEIESRAVALRLGFETNPPTAAGMEAPIGHGFTAPAARALLASAIDDKVRAVEQRVFALLGALYPDADMERIHLGIRDAEPSEVARRRSTALELLEQLLPSSEQALLVPLLEEAPRTERLRLAREQGAVGDVPSEADALAALAADDSPWVRAAAVSFAAFYAFGAPGDAVVVTAATDPDGIVRETALRALQQRDPQRARQVAQGALGDDAAHVRQRAALIVALPA